MRPGASSRPGAAGAILVGILALAAHLPALGNGVVWDDHFLLDEGTAPSLRHVLLEPFRLGEESLPYYRPLVNLTIALERSLWGVTPAAHHAVNIVFHTLASLLLLRLLLRFVSPVPAVLAAGVFAVHPVHVEAVAFIVGRCDLLAALMVLASLAVLCARDLDPPAPGAVAAAAGFFLLALFSKENAVLCVAVPSLLLLRGGGPRPSRKQIVGATLPFVGALAVYVALRFWALGLGADQFKAGKVTASLAQYPPWLFEVVRLLVFPRRLVPYYVIAEPTLGLAVLQLGGVALMIAAAVALGRARKWDLPWTLGAAVLILPLVPALPVFPRLGSLFAERFLYLPSVGFAILVAAGADRLWRAQRGNLAKAAVTIFCAAAILAGAAWSALRVTDWRDDVRLYSRSLARDPGNYVLVTLLADEFILRGGYGEAERLLTRAVALNDSFPRAGIGLGVVYQKTGRPDQARRAFRNVIAHDGGNADALLRLGVLEIQQGNPAAAREALLRLLALRPDSAPALRALGSVEVRAGSRGPAEDYWRRALALAPGDVATLVDLGMLMAQEGRRDAARELFRKALAIDPGQATARDALIELGD